MASIIEALGMLASKGWWKEWQDPAWQQFVLTGDEKHLKALPSFKDRGWFPAELLDALPGPDQLDISGRRFLRACRAAGHPESLGVWIQRVTSNGAPTDQFSKACTVAAEIGYTQAELAAHVALHVHPNRMPDGSPTAAGKFILSLADKEVEELFLIVRGHSHQSSEFVSLFVANALHRWKQLLEHLTIGSGSGWRKLLGGLGAGTPNWDFYPRTWLLPLAAAPDQFLELTAKAFENLKDWNARFEVGAKLFELDPARFGPAMDQFTVGQLLAEDTMANRPLWRQASQTAGWLIANRGTGALPQLKSYFAAPLSPQHKGQAEYKNLALTEAADNLGRGAIPLFEACFATAQPEVHLHALKLWAGVADAGDAPLVAPKISQLLGEADATHVARAVRLAAEFNPELVEAKLWELLSHKSRPVRDAAAVVLAKLGDSRLPKADELWKVRRAETRVATVNWLKALGTPAASAAMKARLDTEEDDNVRDAILLALEKAGGDATTDPAELRQRIEKTLGKIKGPPVPWLDPQKLLAPKLKDGSSLPADWLLYLLYRQSRVKEMRADIEARPLFQQLDRKSSGDLALSVAQAFFGSNADADDRWTMAFAALVGDDRLVPVFTRQIKDWADNMRGKLAEYAVQALALLGTDAALLAVDAMAIRYRSKNKNIGKAASEAFAAAAEARGLTVEELGDLVVPWLGFQPGQPRIVETGKARIEARISDDFKLTFRDVATNKKVAKLPDSASAEVKAEFKELSAGLKEAVKSQLLRMETLMVRQFRWPAARWQELYLQHPLLLPFAQRLVWGAYDATGKLIGTFRTLEDRSLTDSADESFNLPGDSLVGVVHPLELTAEARQTWLKHLADYDIVPPFGQLERTVVTVKPEQSETRFGDEVAGTDLNAMTFKGRAERLGWARGSVCDAGCINYYQKTFPAAGADVFVETEGMYVGIDMYSNIKLGKIFFVKHGSVRVGSYEYNEPHDAKDARLLKYGDVPAIAFSEAMGDLTKIAGKGDGVVEA